MDNQAESKDQDKTMPGNKWEFDSEVTECFNDMLARSIPQYDVMRKAVFDLACHYRKPNKHIIDLGSSRGEALKPLLNKFGCQNNYVAVEVSEPMLASLHQQYGGWEKCGSLEILNTDLRHDYPERMACVTQAILVVQFTPIEYRQKILKNIYDHTIDGGALIMVEKVLGADADIDEIMVDVYYAMKKEKGYTQEQIDRKRLSLEGVLVPVTAAWNEELMKMAGFRKVDCFWRWMNFAGWIAVK